MIGLQKLVGRSYRSLWLFSALGISKAQLAQDLQTGVSETGETVIIQPGKPNAPKYQVGQAIRFTSIYPTPDALINEHLSAEALWTQVGTITAKLPDRQNLYRVENSGHLLGYVNDGDIAELWRPQTKKSFLIGVDEGIVLRAGQPSLLAPIYGIWPKILAFITIRFILQMGMFYWWNRYDRRENLFANRTKRWQRTEYMGIIC